MKKILLLFLALFISTASFSQGILNLFGRSQDLFKLLSEDKYTEAYSYFDPAFQAKVTEANIKDLWAKLSEKFGKMENAGVVSSKTEGDFYTVILEVKFANDSQNFLLAFNKTEKIVGLYLQPKSSAAAYTRPVYADTALYKEKEIYVKTPGHSLVGMLTEPKKGSGYPVVVLVHGSGPQDMDETMGPNKPLKDLALGLASKGIASIRYVKRTKVYPMDFVGANTVKEEVLDDALAAIALARTLPEVNKKQLYLFGHSLGGMLAPRIALLAPDLNGILLAAAPARSLTDIIVEQNRYFFELAKDTTAAGKLMLDSVNKKLDVTRITKLGTIKADSALFGLPAAYWIDLNNYKQVETAKKLKQRIFVAQGGNDFQVSVTDYNLWSAALGKKKNATLKLYPDLNHLLSSQTEKGTLQQYDGPANVSSVLIDDIVAWIKAGT
ncbi:alpha/beta fold hydrolase [Pedobacter heparinus]|uniref:Dienelactone hydrolase n=1 Tax=Pedobacter heparinus (strain ATCC 13125 / DSM 2366 / CIP 104194 / JCM 7457 / NBRC 12017 / NCIMB 9290 / NRRL B-14731 / HIM 762-3) TaxID=485917 RepID=C6XTC2_PEDHD|nr:alpha/beta fold hydrolase [Pedobacter heparinus]ACU05700.1 Dienelactone hydrolase [Pedobacter heparinus DSM 2366]